MDSLNGLVGQLRQDEVLAVLSDVGTERYRVGKDHIPMMDFQCEECLENLEKIEQFLNSLSEEEQELFRLRFLGELSYKEMAKILEKNEGALRVAVGRLKKKISEHLKNESR